MPKVVYTQRFARDLAGVTSPRVEAAILNTVDNIIAFPEIGSAVVPESISRAFGNGVRKFVVNPFDVVYTLGDDAITFEALVPCRAAW